MSQVAARRAAARHHGWALRARALASDLGWVLETSLKTALVAGPLAALWIAGVAALGLGGAAAPEGVRGALVLAGELTVMLTAVLIPLILLFAPRFRPRGDRSA